MIPSDLPAQWRSEAERFRSLGAEAQAKTLEWCAGELELSCGECEAEDAQPRIVTTSEPRVPWTWREKLWIAPAETRIGTSELAEAIGRPKSWVYARTQAGAEDPLPHRKLDGALLFVVGEVRAWLREREDPVYSGPMQSSAPEKRGFHIL